MNDVVQNSRKQGPEFLRVFSAVLSHAMKDCAKAADAKVMASLDRLVRIWHERHVFEPDQLQCCRQILDKFAPRNAGRQSEGKTASASTGTDSAASAAAPATVAVGVAVGQDDDDDLPNEEEGDSDDSGQEGPVSPALRDAGVGSDDDDDNNGVGVGSAIATGYGGGAGVAASASALRAGLAEAREAAAAAAEAEAAEEQPDSEQILAELQFLAAAPSGSAEMRRRISRFPKHIVEEASVDACKNRRDCQRLLREVTQADEVCSAYNAQLSSEVARRRGFHSDLRAYCRQQRAALATGQRRLEDQRRRLRELRSLQKELSSHLANLPDLASLPAVSGGLAPLPTTPPDMHRRLEIDDNVELVSDESDDSDNSFDHPGIESLLHLLGRDSAYATRSRSRLHDAPPRLAADFANSRLRHSVHRLLLDSSGGAAESCSHSHAAGQKAGGISFCFPFNSCTSAAGPAESSSASDAAARGGGASRVSVANVALNRCLSFGAKQRYHLAHQHLPNNTRVVLKGRSFFFCGLFSEPGDVFMCAAQGTNSPIRLFDTREGNFRPLKSVTYTQMC
uniref:CID domain-containing protein n=1 Tax=Macrostomum lignano TaxID=282301 RepID=A0A1I8HI48_9PLAT